MSLIVKPRVLYDITYGGELLRLSLSLKSVIKVTVDCMGSFSTLCCLSRLGILFSIKRNEKSTDYLIISIQHRGVFLLQSCFVQI